MRVFIFGFINCLLSVNTNNFIILSWFIVNFNIFSHKIYQFFIVFSINKLK
jgi:hypothetical protein